MTPTHQPRGADSFDYIIVGSGAGGGPLAARLAQAAAQRAAKGLDTFRVLVIEAGPDHAEAGGPPLEASLVPGLHGVSTEHPDLSWEFFVEHYDKPPAGPDPKRYQRKPKDAEWRDGIFYPRAAGLGGCTVHNAMITIAGPDSDWEDLADFVADDSWRGAAMRAYFQKLERNEYSKPPTLAPTSWWGRARDLVKWLFGFEPDHARGKHGFRGWLRTSVTDLAIGLSDRQLIGMLKGALWQSKLAGVDRAWTLVHRFLRGRITQALDPNHSKTQAESPEGVVLIPLAVCGKRTTIHQSSETPFVMRGRRSSPRELLLATRASHPEFLEIWTDTLVTRVLFEDGKKPRAIGVKILKGRRLYGAHPDPSTTGGVEDEVFVKPGGEVILCGGAFNTPQLLMLSGLGPADHLDKVAGQPDAPPNACVLLGPRDKPLYADTDARRRIHMPGVGNNLQDRYEVTLISRMRREFSLLKDATFLLPGNGVAADRHVHEWRAEGSGLYTSNGAVLGIFKRSHPDLAQPDLFIFGIPLPFEGYKIDYSKVGDQHDYFTWAILKGHTRNSDGTVRLRSADPQHPPLINFHYFNELSCPNRSLEDPDLTALVEGVKFVRGIARHSSWFVKWVQEEVHPGLQVAPKDDDRRIKEWIQRDAWGHHACGTCRMGPRDDEYAVLDSRFAVRNVSGLRVVDASIFPRIPGYFVVTNIYMASEKAADVLLEDRLYRRADTAAYPRDLRAIEADALSQRRQNTSPDPDKPQLRMPSPRDGDRWAADVTGLALSGGGIRSATLALGVVQALARHQWLRRIDFLSTVSGGGYIGSFLGRWYDRFRRNAEWGTGGRYIQSAPDRIERELNDPESPAIAWLRRHGNYLAPTGEGDGRVNTAVFIRNFLTVHFVVASLLFVVFGLANAVRYGLFDPATAGLGLALMSSTDLPLGRLLQAALGVFYSPWFVVFELILLFMVIPRIVGYWIVSQDKHGRFSGPPLFALFLLVGVLLFLAVRNGFQFPPFFIALALLTSFVHVELAWRRGRIREEAIGRGGVETQRLRTRNYLTYDLGMALVLAGGALTFALIDTGAHAVQQAALADNRVYWEAFAALAAAVAALAPVIRFLANLFAREKKASRPSVLTRFFKEQVMAGLLAAVLLILPLFLVSFAAHAAYQGGTALWTGLGATFLALILSLIIALPGALVFINRSSLAQTYAARLARAYLGASNPLRYRPQGANVTEVMAEDDVATIREYKPYMVGGPLHLINVTVNQTVDFTSLRGNRDRKGENLAVSSIGMSIGERWHTAWLDPEDGGAPRNRRAPLKPLGYVPGTDHPLIDAAHQPTEHAEAMSLRQWMGISGAAVGPGRGQTTKLGTALLFGLANLRTGYWWDSGIAAYARDGFPPLTFLQRWFYVLQSLFLTQTLLISEWVARYPGPWERFWHISDGGFFENLAAYELIRRRVPRIIICDGSADPTYEMDGFASLMRKVRIDFDASIEPFPAAQYAAAGIPAGIQAVLGTLDDLKPVMDANGKITAPSKKHAALFRVRYPDGPAGPERTSVLLYLKASLTGDETADVQHYFLTHPEFPHEGTTDQIFEEAQWESYRVLGDHIGSCLGDKGARAWFWNIPL